MDIIIYQPSAGQEFFNRDGQPADFRDDNDFPAHHRLR